MAGVKLLTSDLNGTLVHSHTMQEMIRLAFPNEPHRYRRAREAFSLQTQGRLSMEETFRIAGEATKGLSLRSAIDYATEHMVFIHGYAQLIDFLACHGIHFAVITTGYSITLYTIRHGLPAPPFHASCNHLVFSETYGRVIGERELEGLVKAYLQVPEMRRSHDYDHIRSTGEVVLGLRDEQEKARLALDLARSKGIPPHLVSHMGDTMGDSGGILGVAQAGGLGIAFNYNQALEVFLRTEGNKEMEAGRILLVDPRGPCSTLEHVLPLLEKG